MEESMTVLIMAAGTGGHVFPALSIAALLRASAINVEWLATLAGMENELLANTDIPVHQVSVKGLRGAGPGRWAGAPFMLAVAFLESFRLLNRVKPDCVIGMGGFVCGPAGLACRLQGRPLLIHEQNAVAGLTNRILARIATGVFEAFQGTFGQQSGAQHTGNPLRGPIVELAKRCREQSGRSSELRVLVLGGSQGAQAINRLIPEVISGWRGNRELRILHQTGASGLQSTRACYASARVPMGDACRVQPFIEDMATAYEWADVAICRAGAGTVSEIAAVGLPSLLIPYPHHRDRQQTHNANWLVKAGAAVLIQQDDLDAGRILEQLHRFDRDQQHLQWMGRKARDQSILDADQRIVSACLEVLHVRR